jgi:hypothetical protein
MGIFVRASRLCGHYQIYSHSKGFSTYAETSSFFYYSPVYDGDGGGYRDQERYASWRQWFVFGQGDGQPESRFSERWGIGVDDSDKAGEIQDW